MKQSDFSWANGSIESAVELLAKKACMIKQADPTTFNPGASIGQGIGDSIVNSNIGNAVRFGLGGAAVGGLLGGVSSLSAPAKKRRTGNDIATGALLGGLTGSGIGLTGLNPFGGGDKSRAGLQKAEIQRDADMLAGMNNYGVDESGNPRGWLSSRYYDYLNSPTDALKLIGKHPFDPLSWENAGRRMDVLGLRHFTDPNMGDPFTGRYGRGGYLGPLSLGTFHADTLASGLAIDRALTSLRRSHMWRDPTDIIEGLKLHDNPLAKRYAEILESLTGQERVRLLRNRDPGTGEPIWNPFLKRYATPDDPALVTTRIPSTFIQNLTAPPNEKTVRFIPQTFEAFQNSVRNMRSQIGGSLVNPLTGQKGQLPEPPGPNASLGEHQNYQKALTETIPVEFRKQFVQDQNTINNYVKAVNSAGGNITPEMVSKAMYGSARYTPLAFNGTSLAKLEYLEGLANNQPQFRQQINPSTVNMERSYNPYNPLQDLISKHTVGQTIPTTGFQERSVKLPLEELQGYSRPELTELQKVKLNLLHGEHPPEYADYAKALTKLRDTDLANYLERGKQGKNVFAPVGQLGQEELIKARGLAQEARAAKNENLGYTKRLMNWLGSGIGGPGQKPVGIPIYKQLRQRLARQQAEYEAEVVKRQALRDSSLEAYSEFRAPPGEEAKGPGWFTQGRRGIGAAGRASVNFLGNIPRAAYVLGPPIAQEFAHHRGTKTWPFGNSLPQEVIDYRRNPEWSLLHTPGNEAFVNKEFEGKADELSKLLARPDGKTDWNLASSNLSTREKMKILSTLQAPDTKPVKADKVREILGLKPSKLPTPERGVIDWLLDRQPEGGYGYRRPYKEQ